MTKSDLAQVVGTELIRSTTSPVVFELRPKGLEAAFADYRPRLERLVATFLGRYSQVFYCPHEPDEGERDGAGYLQWTRVAPNTWMLPRGVTERDVMHDPQYRHGWTLYAAPAPLSASAWERQGSAFVVLLDGLIRTKPLAAVVVSDPDGTPWLAVVS